MCLGYFAEPAHINPLCSFPQLHCIPLWWRLGFISLLLGGLQSSLVRQRSWYQTRCFSLAALRPTWTAVCALGRGRAIVTEAVGAGPTPLGLTTSLQLVLMSPRLSLHLFAWGLSVVASFLCPPALQAWVLENYLPCPHLSAALDDKKDLGINTPALSPLRRDNSKMYALAWLPFL